MVGKRILIVEDEIITAKDIKECLQDIGYMVLAIVSSGEEAIKKAEEANPDLILMDIVLKGEMDGIETAKQIRSISNIPIIYLTAYSDKNILERAKITEPFGYILKPFNERELQINIEIALYKNKAERELKESERWLASLIKNLGEAVIATDENGIIKLMNPFAEALTGWKQEDALGKYLINVFDIISEGSNVPIENPVLKAIREDIFYGLANNTMLITKEGMKIPVDIIGSTIKDDTDSIIGIAIIFSDIFERLNIEKALKIHKHFGEILTVKQNYERLYTWYSGTR
jgi:PAS domain S-box-containing protein